MTASRSFEPVDQDVDDAPDDLAAAPPVFPMLPFAYMAYAEHCSHDYADYVDKMVHADQKPVAAEDVLGLQMLTDMNRAFFALVWAPLGAAISRTQARP